MGEILSPVFGRDIRVRFGEDPEKGRVRGKKIPRNGPEWHRHGVFLIERVSYHPFSIKVAQDRT